MKYPKLSAVLLVCSAAVPTVVGQTNVFPSSGNVGIGTTAPDEKLHVNGVTLSGAGGDATQGSLAFAIDYYGANQLNTWGSEYASAANIIGYAVKPKPGAVGVVSSAGNAAFNKGALRVSNELIFSNALGSVAAIDSDVLLTERLRVDANGNVGIGTSTPGFKLDVQHDNYNAIRATGNSTNAIGIYINNSVTGGNQWGITSAGGGPAPLGTLVFWDDGAQAARMAISSAGNVGVGTTSPSHKLAVNGTIRAKEVIVDTGWADYVFAEDYELAPLSEIEAHIEEKGHLPDIPSAEGVAESGISLGEIQSLFLAKIEELTLHTIRQEKRLEAQELRLDAQESELRILQRQNALLRNQTSR